MRVGGVVTGVVAALVVAGCSEGTWPEVRVLSGKTVEDYAADLEGPDPDLRREAVFELKSKAQWGSAELKAEIAHIYRRVLGDPAYDPLTRAAAGGGANSVALTAALEDEHAEVRIAAIRALERLGEPSAVPDLARVLAEDKDPDVRAASARSLRRFKGPEVLAALVDALDDRAENVSFVAAESLEKLSGRSFGRDSRAWRRWLKEESQRPPKKFLWWTLD